MSDRAGPGLQPVTHSSWLDSDGAEQLRERSRGVFAGLALSGATLRRDLDENYEVYGRKLSTKEIVAGQVPNSSIS